MRVNSWTSHRVPAPTISGHLVAGAAGGMAGVTLLVVGPRTYTAKAKIFIGTQKAPFIQQQSLFAETPIDNAQIE